MLRTNTSNVVLGAKRLLAGASIRTIVSNGGLIFGCPVLRGVIRHFGGSILGSTGHRRTVVDCSVSRCSRHFLHRLTLNCAGRVVTGLEKVPFKIGSLRGQRGSLINHLFPPDRQIKIGTAHLIIHTLRLQVLGVSGLRTSSRWAPGTASHCSILPTSTNDRPPFVSVQYL